MDWSWADADFMKQAASVALGALLTGVFALVLAIVTAIVQWQHRKAEHKHAKEQARDAAARKRFEDFRGPLTTLIKNLNLWHQKETARNTTIADPETDMIPNIPQGMMSFSPLSFIEQRNEFIREGNDPESLYRVVQDSIIDVHVASPDSKIADLAKNMRTLFLAYRHEKGGLFMTTGTIPGEWYGEKFGRGSDLEKSLNLVATCGRGLHGMYFDGAVNEPEPKKGLRKRLRRKSAK